MDVRIAYKCIYDDGSSATALKTAVVHCVAAVLTVDATAVGSAERMQIEA
jgi:hypothetical protein